MRYTNGFRKVFLIGLLFVWIAGQAGSASAGANVWTEVGPWGSTIQALAIDPVHPHILYAGTYDHGIFKTTDAGATWQAINTGIYQNSSIVSLVVHPLNPSIVYAGVSFQGVFKSTNGGGSWSATGYASGQHFIDLAVDPMASGTLYGIVGGVLKKSTDDGSNWFSLTAGLMDAQIIDVQIDPITSSTLYAIGQNAEGDSNVFMSTNAGQAWTLVDVDHQNNVISLAINPVAPEILYAGASGGVYKSMDGGETWNAFKEGLGTAYITALTVHPVITTTLYAEAYADDAYRLFQSVDAGESWRVMNARFPQHPGMVVDPADAATIYARGSLGVQKSIDAGESWHVVNTGMGFDITDIAIAAHAPGELYVGSRHGVYKSTDQGVNWFPVNTGLEDFNVSVLRINPQNPHMLYAQVYLRGLYRSTDGGANWVGIFADWLICDLAFDPITPGTIYAGNMYDVPWGGGGVLKSTNGGVNWIGLNSGPITEKVSICALAIDPHFPNTIYAGTNIAMDDEAADGVFKSTDGGENWRVVNTGLPEDHAITGLLVDPLVPEKVYAITTAGVFKSTDGGNSWHTSNAGLPDNVYELVADPNVAGTLYGATAKGVYKTTDGGESWVALNNGLAGFFIHRLAIDPLNPNRLYAGTYGGLFVIDQGVALAIDHAGGAPGSSFTVTGSGFAANETVTLSLNGQSLGTVTSDPSGGFVVLLKTTAATDEGSYSVTASASASAAARFVLFAGGEVHPQQGSGTVFDVPEGRAYPHMLFVPLTRK